jgi:membrane protein DedA with SNARE-associated domain
VNTITDWLSRSSGPAVYAVVAALVFCEDALFFGFVLPGESAVVLGGVVASRGHISVVLLCAVVAFAAVAGDSAGYEVGRRLGPRILETRLLRGHSERIGRAQELIRRRGPAAVFLGRFIAFFRAMMPALAGMSRMPYRTFLLFNAAGGVIWGVGFTVLGYFAGAAYQKVEKTAGTVVAVVVAAVVVAALVAWHIRRRRRGGEQEGEPGSRPGPESRSAPEPESGPESAPRPESEPESKSGPRSEPRSESKSGPQPGPESGSASDSPSESPPESDSHEHP